MFWLRCGLGTKLGCDNEALTNVTVRCKHDLPYKLDVIFSLVQNKHYWVQTDDRYECTAHSQASINQHNVTSPRHCSFCTLKGLSPITCTQLPCPVPHMVSSRTDVSRSSIMNILKNIVISIYLNLLNWLLGKDSQIKKKVGVSLSCPHINMTNILVLLHFFFIRNYFIRKWAWVLQKI